MISLLSKTYELSLTRNYVSRWGMAHAVRELIQNALDSESPFAYSFNQVDDEFHLTLNSEFTVLTPQTLLLGSTSKTDRDDAIGSFGEGYKIALLVLTRLGYDVEMRNGDRLWRPRFRHSKTFGEELLVIDDTSLTDRTNKGLTFVIRGLSESDVSEIRASCLKMQSEIGEVKKTSMGSILLGQPGKLYVGSLFVCETKMKFGYDFNPSLVKLERDRQTISAWDLGYNTTQMWFETGEWERIATMMKDEYPDLAYAEYGSPEMVKEACYRLFISANPGGVIAKSQDELKQLVKQGMPKVTVYGSSFASAVSSAPSYYSRPSVRILSPTERMERWCAKAKYNMGDEAKRTFRDLLTESKNWKL